MMNKELCFCIENKDIYLEQILVDYMNIPIFFLCSESQQYYVALCTDIDELNYIVVKLSLVDVYYLLHGIIPMRDVILKQKEYWDIVSGNEIASDLVVKKSIDEIELETLPEEAADFKILTEQMRLFVQKFDNEFLANQYFLESDKTAEMNGFSTNLPVDTILENINWVKELLVYEIQEPLPLKELSYDEEMKLIEKSEPLKRFEIGELFELVESNVNSMEVAA